MAVKGAAAAPAGACYCDAGDDLGIHPVFAPCTDLKKPTGGFA